MPVLINFKICDNAKECNGVAVCPTGALAWDEKKKSIKIDNKKCISCEKCEKACMVDAIFIARNEKEYQKIEKEIDADPRKRSDLFIDRYGAEPIHPAFLIKDDKFQIEVLESEKSVMAEFFDDDSIMCLLKSIPVKDLLVDHDMKYRKVKIEKELTKKLKIKKLPALLFFEKAKLLGKIEGYYDNKKKAELCKKIEAIIKKK
ncbi:MAG: 4Fe-4S dicluster domain-containing protein [Parcubacteria group bacterium]|jgi:Fe-S-cluster-containing hydrogenase component 2